jgi:outer membrane autotransporter protein
MSGEIHVSLGMLDVQQQDAFNHSISLRTGRISAGGESGGYTSAKPVQLASAGSTLPPMQQEEEDQLLDNIWLQGFGSFGHLNGDGNASGGNFTIGGTSGGFDYRLSPEMLVGLAVGYSHDSADVGGPGASGNVDAIQLACYGGYVNGLWHLDGIFSYGFLQTDTKRFINVGSIHQEADGSYDGGVLSLSTEGGYVFGTGPVTIEPTLGLNYARVSQDGFNETGHASDGHNYGLNVHSVEMNSLRTVLGVRLAAQFGEKDDVQFIPELRAGWEHEFLDQTADVNARFVGGSGDFIVRGVELGADSGVVGAGLTVSFNKAIQAFVNFDARMNERISSHTISGGLSFSW